MNSLLELLGVSKAFGELVALEDVSFAAEEGMLLCIIGPSGCGKTTLLRIIAGLTRPTDGKIHFNGRRVDGPSPERGFVFQEYGLFPWRTVAGNIRFGLEIRGLPRTERECIVHRYIKLVGLEGFEQYYPGSLSGGMKQRVGIARALANDPSVILMDEPFGALDAQTRQQMRSELLRIWAAEGKTIVYVTHSVSEALALGDRIVVLSSRPGRVLEILDVDLPRPRPMASPEMVALRERVLGLLGASDL